MLESIETRIEKKSEELEKRQVNLEIDSKSIDRKINFFTWLAWICIILGLGVLILGFSLFFWKKIPDLNELGGFLSGTLASVWSLSGLFFIYVAFLGQKKQLLLQQIELLNSQLEVMYTQSELKGQKEAMNTQNDLITQQQFENTFFKLMENQIDLVKSMKINKKAPGTSTVNTVIVGKPCMIEIINEINRGIGIFLEQGFNSPLEKQLTSYKQSYSKYSGLLSYYFRNLYNIIKFVHESRMENKKRYTNFIRAQFSPAEIEILVYNGISHFGVKKFKTLIEEYSLLKHCENQQLRERAISESWYSPKAFGEFR